LRIDFGNGTYTTYSYDSDPRYRVNSIAHYRAGTPAVELATISYATRDAVGNPESIVDWVGTWSYGYDANNRLDWALVPDVVGGPAARAVPSQPACGDYVYDWVGNRLRPPYGTGNEMVYNKADQLIRWPGMHTYAYDGTGNLTQVKNDSETQVVKSYAYDAYGSLLSHDRFEGSVNQPYQYVGQLGYYTHWMEPDFGLLQLGVRFYDPEVGRFTQRDAVRAAFSSYAYTSGNPLSFADPSGLQELPPWYFGDCPSTCDIGKRPPPMPIDPARDVALSKCLRRIQRCLPQFAEIIDSVKWQLNFEITGAAETCCGPLGGRTISFNPDNGEPWSQRYDSEEKYHSFCTTVLHELIHASHGFWRCTYADAWKEIWDPYYFQKQAEQMYRQNRRCLSDG